MGNKGKSKDRWNDLKPETKLAEGEPEDLKFMAALQLNLSYNIHITGGGNAL